MSFEAPVWDVRFDEIVDSINDLKKAHYELVKASKLMKIAEANKETMSSKRSQGIELTQEEMLESIEVIGSAAQSVIDSKTKSSDAQEAVVRSIRALLE